jgi:DNA-binding CsgD family transcriptional regulator
MIELSSHFASASLPQAFSAEPWTTAQALGAAQGSDATLARWLTLSLDHVGRGMLLVTSAGRVLHANRLARSALTAQHPLQLDQGRLRARCPLEDRALADALHAAQHRSLRRMLTLSGDGRKKVSALSVNIAILPLAGTSEGSGAALVSLPQPDRCQDLAVQCFARQCQLTSAETSVLLALLNGQAPSEVARHKGVALSTVRTQVARLRRKAGSHSVLQLLDKVRALPPMMGVVE